MLRARERNSENYTGLCYDSGSLFRRFRLVRWITPAHEILIRTRDSDGFMDYTTQQNQELRQNFGTHVHNNMRIHLGMDINIVLVFRALHDRTPVYLASLITQYVPSRALRSAGQALLTVPRHNLERYGRRSFACAGPTLWNALPEDIRVIANINAFKSKLKTHYFKVAFN